MTEPQGDDDYVDVDADPGADNAASAIVEGGSALPTESTAAIASEPSLDDSTDRSVTRPANERSTTWLWQSRLRVIRRRVTR